MALVLALASAGLTLAVGTSSAAADSTTLPPIRSVGLARVPAAGVSPAGNGGHIGVSLYLANGVPGWGYDPCATPGETYAAACDPSGYYKVKHWTAAGNDFSPRFDIPNVESGLPTAWANKVMNARFELYPYAPAGGYDPWAASVGGAWVNATPFTNQVDGNAWSPDLGTIKLPRLGDAGVVRMAGSIVSNASVPDGRVRFDVFQEHSQYDPYPYTKTSTGVDEGAFNEISSKGAQWQTGYLFSGLYHIFITDTLRGTSIDLLTPVLGDTVFDIDLEATCFGFDECRYFSPQPYAPIIPTGRYHALSPSRIFDSRDGTGRPFGVAGKVTQGDGSLPLEPNNFIRLEHQINHEVQVTGVGGVPLTGVSAVVMNVTAVAPEGDSHLTVFPKPPRSDLYCDESSFFQPSVPCGTVGPTTVPNASNLNFRAGQTIANLVVVRVGAGGKVRIASNTGATHVIFDVVGWFDTGFTGSSGDGFTGISPIRLMDTRPATQVGPDGTPFTGGMTRSLALAEAGGIPADATAAVLNVTAVFGTAASHLTVWPSGIPRPGVSNLNFVPTQIAPNLVVVKIGSGGLVDIFNNSGSVDVLVDAVGYFTATGGSRFTPVAGPTRILDTRYGIGGPATSVGAAEVRPLQVTGAAGIPVAATAVALNVTATAPSGLSHLTVFPDGTPAPTASNLNFFAGQTVPNLVMVKLGTGGRIGIRNNSATVHVIADVAGYYSP